MALLGATQLAEAMVNFYPCVIFWKMSDFNGKMLKFGQNCLSFFDEKIL